MTASHHTRPVAPRHLVLVGGGHSHVQVLESFAMEPPPATRVTVVLDIPIAVYSGMVPGFVAGQYRAEELEIDVVPLARRAGAEVVLAAAVGIDPRRRRVLLEGRPPLAYDLASLDVGSTVAGLDLPGVREHALPSRPIGRFVQRVEEIGEARRAAGGAVRVVVVGGGAGGVELAFTLERRLQDDGDGPGAAVTLVHASERPLPGYTPALVRAVEREAARRGIELLAGRKVVAAREGEAVLDDGGCLPAEVLVWVTGAVAHPGLFADPALPTDERGFLSIRSSLQVEGFDDLLAAGDCATLVDWPRTPKAGVYAVRQGPVLTANLRAVLAGRPLERYRPQGDFLTLLNLGDGRALGAKWGLAVGGRWVMRWKDRIDRRFMERFQLLEADGRLTPAAAERPEMEGGDGGPMLCGGCAAKLRRPALERALERLGPSEEPPEILSGLAEADDAAAWSLPGGDVVVASVDAFSPFVADPWTVGRAAAVNALSDVLVGGGRPRWAFALVTVPEEEGPAAGEETLFQLLAGARSAFDADRVVLVGGHTSTGPRLQVGFWVGGPADPDAVGPAARRARPGDRLVLTRPLGAGVLFRAHMRGRCRGPWLESALAAVTRSNAPAAAAARRHGAEVATDVTGFGLAGHLVELVERLALGARLELAALPALPGALELLALGERSTSHADNELALPRLELADGTAGHPRLPLLFDPQTSGGLLLAVPAGREEAVLGALRRAGEEGAAVVGRITGGREGPAVEVIPAG